VFLLLRIAAAIGLIFYLSPLRDRGPDGQGTVIPGPDLAGTLYRFPEPVRDRILEEALSSTLGRSSAGKAMLASGDTAVAHGHAPARDSGSSW
jgi:hypothetical protein